MSQIDQEGLKIIFRHKIFFPLEMTKTLQKFTKKFQNSRKKIFGLKMIFGPSRSLLDQKNFLRILKNFREIFSKCFGHFQLFAVLKPMKPRKSVW